MEKFLQYEFRPGRFDVQTLRFGYHFAPIVTAEAFHPGISTAASTAYRSDLVEQERSSTDTESGDTQGVCRRNFLSR